MARVLVTGGCGFIGSHVVEALTARGDIPVVLDDLSSGKRDNIASNVSFIEGSILDDAARAIAFDGVDAVIHLAAIASVQRCNEAWSETHQVNLTGTIQIFEAARDQGGIPVAYASSAAVYGDATNMPISETAPLKPLTAYGSDKLCAELHAAVAGRIHGVPSMGLRFFNVYGPRQDPSSPYSGVISIFSDRIGSNVPVTIFGNGKQERDFINVTDVVRHLLAGLDTASVDAPVFNVCTGTGISILELAHLIKDLSGSSSEIRHGPDRRGDIYRSVGDPHAARAVLGLKAEVSLTEGLRLLMAS